MTPSSHRIAELLVDQVSRDLVMGIEDALNAGARRGYIAGAKMDTGHKAAAVGQMRHFHSNEAFRDALEAAGANPTNLKGNQIVVGQSGMFSIARFHSDIGIQGGKKSKARARMSEVNKVMEELVLPDLFQPRRVATNACVFFMSSSNKHYNGQDNQPPLSGIEIGVPSPDMQGWLFHEPIEIFLRRYEAIEPVQQDNLTVRLKKDAKKRDDQEERR